MASNRFSDATETISLQQLQLETEQMIGYSKSENTQRQYAACVAEFMEFLEAYKLPSGTEALPLQPDQVQHWLRTAVKETEPHTCVGVFLQTHCCIACIFLGPWISQC